MTREVSAFGRWHNRLIALLWSRVCGERPKPSPARRNHPSGAERIGEAAQPLDGGSVAAGADAAIGAQAAGSNVAADVTLVEITDQGFANASALATALEGAEHLIFSGVPAAGGASHVLVAYNDGTGATRIANIGVIGSSPDTHYDAITGSDMVQLLGVSATSLSAHNVHFLA